MLRIFRLKHKLPPYGNKEMRDKIMDMIHDKTDRKIMYMKLIDNCTLLEISKKLDIPYSTVRDHYYTNRAILFPKKTPG